MIPIAISETLCQITQQTQEVEAMLARINTRLEHLYTALNAENTREPGPNLSSDDVARLLNMNRQLTKLETFLAATGQALDSVLAQKAADSHDPMADYEIDAVLHYTLREQDAEWREDSDNFMSSREHSLKRNPQFTEATDWRMYFPGWEAINAEPHCWLFHDLHDHSYGPGKQNIPLRDCLRIGEVWVDVVIRQQYWLNLESGHWVAVNNDAKSEEKQ